jgi:tetratricopeptide (TPR) repeat protein
MHGIARNPAYLLHLRQHYDAGEDARAPSENSWSTFLIPLRFVLCALLAFASPSLSAFASDQSSKFQWTDMQDLKPDARPLNRPIRQKWLVAIGASEFKEKRLDNPSPMAHAAEAFAAYAIDPTCGRFDKDHVRLLVNSEATRQNIMTSLGKSWLGSLAGPDDLVVVFVSTLSFPTTDGKVYLCAYDCSLDNVYSTCVSVQDLMSTLKANVASDRILLILQACYSGAAELTSGAKALFPNYNLDPEQLPLGKGHIILSSSRPDQITWSTSFSDNLIKALRDGDGLTSLQEAFARARARTESDTAIDSKGTRQQTPVMKSDWSGKPLVLGIPPLERMRSIPPSVGTYLAAESHYLQANRALIAGDLDGAIQAYKDAIAVDANYADALGDYASALALKGDWQAAGAMFERAIKARPSDSLFHTNYARVFEQTGDRESARRELALACKLDAKNRTALVALANMDTKDGAYAAAIEHLERAIALYPASATLHDRLAYVLGRTGELESAVKHSQDAVKLDPKLISARLNLGANLLLAGDLTGAVTAYQEASRLAPDNADAHYCLSRTLESAGETDRSQAELEKFIQLAPPSDPRKVEAEEHLRTSREH